MENILNINTLIKYLGNPERKRGQEYEWQCKYCALDGHDLHKDNLKFNEEKGLLYCFCDDRHAKQILSDISKAECKNNDVIYKKKFKKKNILSISDYDKSKIEKYHSIANNPEKQKEFYDYIVKCNNILLNDKQALNILFNKRGINSNTVKMLHIGFDDNKECWIIPNIKYNCENYYATILGYETRPKDFSKKGIKRVGLTGLIEITDYYHRNTNSMAENLVVVEGAFDGYALYQYLETKNIELLYHIVSPSNGVHGLIQQIKEVDFRKYKQFNLFIDNDETSIPIANDIASKYPLFKIIRIDGYKDFNEYYLDYIKQKLLF